MPSYTLWKCSELFPFHKRNSIIARERASHPICPGKYKRKWLLQGHPSKWLILSIALCGDLRRTNTKKQSDKKTQAYWTLAQERWRNKWPLQQLSWTWWCILEAWIGFHSFRAYGNILKLIRFFCRCYQKIDLLRGRNFFFISCSCASTLWSIIHFFRYSRVD